MFAHMVLYDVRNVILVYHDMVEYDSPEVVEYVIPEWYYDPTEWKISIPKWYPHSLLEWWIMIPPK